MSNIGSEKKKTDLHVNVVLDLMSEWYTKGTHKTILSLGESDARYL